MYPSNVSDISFDATSKKEFELTRILLSPLDEPETVRLILYGCSSAKLSYIFRKYSSVQVFE